MRFIVLLLLLSVLSHSAEPTLDLGYTTTCPGDLLHVNAMLSNGSAADDVELRLVLRVPFQGLRALKHTDDRGNALFELTKPGLYRIYIDKSDDYDSEDFVTLNYSEMCPLPPPDEFDIVVEPDCNASLLMVSVTDKGQPLEGVFISTMDWSSLTGAAGKAFFPLEEGYVYVKASRENYTTKEGYFDIDCTPPECLSDENCSSGQYCFNESCVNLTGVCGYAENHTWVQYECCDDEDCGMDFECLNNTCVALPPPENITNITEENITFNVTAVPEEEEPEEICVAAFILLFLLFGRMSGLSG